MEKPEAWFRCAGWNLSMRVMQPFEDQPNDYEGEEQLLPLAPVVKVVLRCGSDLI